MNGEYLSLETAKRIKELTDIINEVKLDIVKTKKVNNHSKDSRGNEFINVDIDHLDYWIKILEGSDKE